MVPPPYFENTNHSKHSLEQTTFFPKKSSQSSFFPPIQQRTLTQMQTGAYTPITSQAMAGYQPTPICQLSPNMAMNPFNEQQHTTHPTSIQPKAIQMDKIDHGQLGWGDFKGKAKGGGYDAKTFSGFHNMKTTEYPFKILEAVDIGTTFTGQDKEIDCEKGKDKDKKADKHPEKYQAFKVDITPEKVSENLDIKAFMDQDKSWKQDWTVDDDAFANKYKKLIKACEKYTAQEGGSYEYNISGKTKVNHGDDCRASLITLRQGASDALLSHEQRHFDITHQMALKAKKEIDDLISGFDKEVFSCGKDAALKKAKATIKQQKKKIDSKFKKIKQTISSFQNSYDNQTNHGLNAEMQSKWGKNIDDGLLEKKLK